MNKRRKYLGGILCGGKASRMNGFPKGNIVVDGLPIIERVNRAMYQWCEEIVLVGNPKPYSHYGIRVIPDEVPELGPAGGILTLLKRFSFVKGIIVCPCDMPLITAKSIGKLIKFWEEGDYDIVVAYGDEKIVPVVGIYSPDIVGKWEKLLLIEGERKLHTLVKQFKYVLVPMSWRELFNVNNKTDVQYLKKLIKLKSDG